MKMTFFKKTALAALLCTAIILVSWTKSNTADIKNITDEEIFNGLVFMKGKVVGMIPELKETAVLQANLTNSATEEKGLTKIQSEVLAKIKAKHPGYLAQFKSIMTSGNHYAISAELRKASIMVNDVLGDILGFNLNQASTKKEEITKLLGAKMQQLKDLYKQYKVGDLTEAEFKINSGAILAEKNGELAKLFPNAQAVTVNNVTSTNSGLCAAINVALNVNVGVNINVGVNVNAGVNVNLGVNINIFRNVNFWFSESEVPMENSEVRTSRMVNSIAERLKA